jgi:hypothetical protein
MKGSFKFELWDLYWMKLSQPYAIVVLLRNSLRETRAKSWYFFKVIFARSHAKVSVTILTTSSSSTTVPVVVPQGNWDTMWLVTNLLLVSNQLPRCMIWDHYSDIMENQIYQFVERLSRIACPFWGDVSPDQWYVCLGLLCVQVVLCVLFGVRITRQMMCVSWFVVCPGRFVCPVWGGVSPFHQTDQCIFVCCVSSLGCRITRPTSVSRFVVCPGRVVCPHWGGVSPFHQTDKCV